MGGRESGPESSDETRGPTTDDQSGRGRRGASRGSGGLCRRGDEVRPEHRRVGCEREYVDESERDK